MQTQGVQTKAPFGMVWHSRQLPCVSAAVRINREQGTGHTLACTPQGTIDEIFVDVLDSADCIGPESTCVPAPADPAPQSCTPTEVLHLPMGSLMWMPGPYACHPLPR